MSSASTRLAWRSTLAGVMMATLIGGQSAGKTRVLPGAPVGRQDAGLSRHLASP